MGSAARALKLIPELEENRLRRRSRIHRPRWNPKRWHPVYEEIVLLSALGYKNTEIAMEKGFTTVHISNILSTPQAKTLLDILMARQRAKGIETFEQRLERYSNKAMDRLDEVLNDDKYAKSNPGGIFDRAITMLKVTGKVKEPEHDPLRDGRSLIVPVEALQLLHNAIALSDKARDIHKLSGGEKENIDATVLLPDGTVVNK